MYPKLLPPPDGTSREKKGCKIVLVINIYQSNKTLLILTDVKIKFTFYVFDRICYNRSNICEIHRIAFAARVIVVNVEQMCFLYNYENLF